MITPRKGLERGGLNKQEAKDFLRGKGIFFEKRVSHRALPDKGLGVARKGGEENWRKKKKEKYLMRTPGKQATLAAGSCSNSHVPYCKVVGTSNRWLKEGQLVGRFGDPRSRTESQVAACWKGAVMNDKGRKERSEQCPQLTNIFSSKETELLLLLLLKLSIQQFASSDSTRNLSAQEQASQWKAMLDWHYGIAADCNTEINFQAFSSGTSKRLAPFIGWNRQVLDHSTLTSKGSASGVFYQWLGSRNFG
ncbi:hypothetical protein ACLOJK_014548 [Asimina triloba]